MKDDLTQTVVRLKFEIDKLISENKELKELINSYVSSSDKLLAKIIVDHKSPFLRSVIINKGSKDNIKIGTNIFDQSYLVGRVIEVNYKTSRVLLLSDLNSKKSELFVESSYLLVPTLSVYTYPSGGSYVNVFPLTLILNLSLIHI